MKIKGKRVLKNGAVAGYVWKDRKWKWRIIKGPSKKRGGGPRTCKFLEKNQNLRDNHPFYKIYYEIMCPKNTKNTKSYYEGTGAISNSLGVSKLAQLGKSIGHEQAFMLNYRYNPGVAYKISKPVFSTEIKLEKWVNGKQEKQMTSEDILKELDKKVKQVNQVSYQVQAEAEAQAKAKAQAKIIIEQLYKLGLTKNERNESTIKTYIRNYLIEKSNIKNGISRNAPRNQQYNFNRKWLKLTKEVSKIYTNIQPYL